MTDSYNFINEIYDKLHIELTKWCFLMTHDEFLSQELVQEGFLRAIDHCNELVSLSFSQQRAWLYQTIKHIYIDTLRKRKRETYLEDSAPGDIENSSDGYSEAEWIALINSLPPLEGKVITLRYLEGFTSTQIGKMLGLSPGTVRSKLSDARKHIKEKL